MEAHYIRAQFDDWRSFIITDAAVQSAQSQPLTVRAMWDTGCTTSCISSEIARRLSLTSVGEFGLKSLHKHTSANAYKIDLILPDKTPVRDLYVAEIAGSERFDIIIGLDVILRGDFSLKNVNGTTVFTFSLPFQSEETR